MRGNSKGSIVFSHRYVKSTLISVLIGEIVMIVALFLFSIIMAKTNVPSVVVDIFVLVSASLGGLVAGFVVGKALKEKGLLFGSLCGGILIVILLAFDIAFNEFTSTAMTLLKLALIVGLSAVGGILGVNKKSKRVKY